MRIASRVALGAAVAACGAVVVLRAEPAPNQAGTYKQAPGPHKVAARTYDWHDAKRDRDVPAKVYFPETGDGPFPLIVFSHGLGGSRDGYEYLGRHWASHGYVSVHVQHIGSDSSVWQGQERPMDAMRKAVRDPRNAVNRPLDVRFTIDQMERLNEEGPELKGRLDSEHIGMAGHSFGAYTTLAAVGEVFVLPGGREASLADARVKAAIPMSPAAPKGTGEPDKAFGQIPVPCLHMTGTKDDSLVTDTKAADRRVPFDHMTGADQYLVTFSDGDHMIFSGRPRRAPGGEKDALFQDLIRQSTTAFWDAYLRDDATAKAWLTDGGLQAMLGANGTLEKKLQVKPAAATRGDG